MAPHKSSEKDYLLSEFDKKGKRVPTTHGQDLENLAHTESQSSQQKVKTPCIVFILIFLASTGNFLVGYHSSVISGAVVLLTDLFHLNYEMQASIVSIMIFASIISSLLACYTNNRLGRKPTMLAASVSYTCGALLLALANNPELLLAGRFIVGIGAGFASSTMCIYVGEGVPVNLRGAMVTITSFFLAFGQFAASIVSGAFSTDTQRGWRYMLGLSLFPSLVMLVGFFFMPESPRWLVRKDKDEEARSVLCRIRGTDFVEEELKAIRSYHEERVKQQESSNGSRYVFLCMLRTRHLLKALFVGCSLHVIHAASGVDLVLTYSATVIKMSGIRDSSTAIWISVLPTVVRLLFTAVGICLIDRIGRKPLMITSLLGTFASLCVIAIGFNLAAFRSPPIGQLTSQQLSNSSCSQYSSCGDCVKDKSCGFCYEERSVWSSGGICLPSFVNQTAAMMPCGPEKPASSWLWDYDVCLPPFRWVVPAGLVIYFAFFALGVAGMPFTINAEIYPVWASSTGNGIATAVKWASTALTSYTFLFLTVALTTYGVFWLYAGFTLVGLIFTTAYLPETKGKTLEEVEELFKEPWC